MVDAWGLKKGMKVNATKVVEVPETQVAQQRKVTGQMPPPPPPPPPADVPMLIVVAEPAMPAEAAPVVTEAPAALPKTGSELPLIGLIGALSLLSGLGLRAIRKAA
jgi:LPXTG-motif cell wall-anchored protein